LTKRFNFCWQALIRFIDNLVVAYYFWATLYAHRLTDYKETTRYIHMVQENCFIQIVDETSVQYST